MKWIIQIIGFCLVFYSLILVAVYFFQGKLLFFPGTEKFGDCPDMEQRNVLAEKTGEIRYYLAAKPDPDCWVIIFHGNAGNACDRTYFLDLLKDIKASIAVFEYPGFGRDSHVPGETIILEQALGLVLLIKKQNKDNRPVYLMGESLGTGVATFAASRTAVSGLILISPYTSIAQVAQAHYPIFPVKLLIRHKFEAHIWAQQVTAPVILFHGAMDDIIPIHFAKEQLLNFKGQKELVEIPHCGHNDLVDTGGPLLKQKIYTFLIRT